MFESGRELRAFEYFRREASQQLCGNHRRELWDRLLLQAAFDDPGIRHALIALGSAHECFRNRYAAEYNDAQAFALEQYSSAIKQHVRSLTKTESVENIESYIVSCIIFICIEALWGRIISAISLIKQGLGLLRGQNTLSADSQWSRDAIEHIFSQFEMQAVKLIGHQFMCLDIPPPHFEASRMEIPEVFSSVTEARDSFDYHDYVIHYSEFLQQASGDLNLDAEHTSNVVTTVQKWSSAFDGFLRLYSENLSESDHYAVRILQLQRLLYSCDLDIGSKDPSDADQMLWDDYTLLFDQMVSHAEAVFKNSEQSTPGLSRPTFTLDIGLVGSMYDIACKCRDPFIRRRAVTVLRDSARVEGIFDGFLAAQIADSVIAAEEAGLGRVKSCSDVPAERRVFKVGRSFETEERKALLCYYPSQDSYVYKRECTFAEMKF